MFARRARHVLSNRISKRRYWAHAILDIWAPARSMQLQQEFNAIACTTIAPDLVCLRVYLQLPERHLLHMCWQDPKWQGGPVRAELLG
jgi:hypothetical protein